MQIAATRSDTEKWRIDRLEKAAKTFCKVYGISKTQADLLIESLYDHKGTLQVYWLRAMEPTPEQVRAFAIAWELCGEIGENVEHNVVI